MEARPYVDHGISSAGNDPETGRWAKITCMLRLFPFDAWNTRLIPFAAFTPSNAMVASSKDSSTPFNRPLFIPDNTELRQRCIENTQARLRKLQEETWKQDGDAAMEEDAVNRAVTLLSILGIYAWRLTLHSLLNNGHRYPDPEPAQHVSAQRSKFCGNARTRYCPIRGQ